MYDPTLVEGSLLQVDTTCAIEMYRVSQVVILFIFVGFAETYLASSLIKLNRIFTLAMIFEQREFPSLTLCMTQD